MTSKVNHTNTLNDVDNNNIENNVLPIIPLSPLVQSYIICTNALNNATEKLAKAKKVNPPVQVGTLRTLIEQSKVESERLGSLKQKMQKVEAATAIYWDSDVLARQIAVIDSQLFSRVVLDKRSLSLLDKEQSKLTHLMDFHHYLSHSFAHQLIYWGELLSNSVAAGAVEPRVNPGKDSLVSHLVRVAYLLLHAYRDFSGFAAIMRALTFPEVRRLKKLWLNTTSRTKEMFRDLENIMSPTKDYHAYHTSIRSKLDLYVNKNNAQQQQQQQQQNQAQQQQQQQQQEDGTMIAIPWIQPHLLMIRSIVAAYTAGDNEDQFLLTGDIVLSTPGVNKLDLEFSVLELCQHNSFSTDFALEEILTGDGTYDIKSPNINKRASSVVNHQQPKAIHIEGLRTAVMPASNLRHLPPGETLVHHWLVSRVYLRKDQLINESMEVEPLRMNETITCDVDPLEEAVTRYHPLSKSAAVSRRASFIPPPSQVRSDLVEQELVDIPPKTIPNHNIPSSEVDHKSEEQQNKPTNSTSDSKSDDDDDNDDQAQSPLESSVLDNRKSVLENPTQETEVSNSQPLTEIASVNTEDISQEQKALKKKKKTSFVESEIKKTTSEKKASFIQSAISHTSQSARSVQSNSTGVSKQKSTLSPSAPVFIPKSYVAQTPASKKAESVVTNTTEDKWVGYPIREDDEVATMTTQADSEKWGGYPIPNKVSDDEDDDEVWKGYPGPISATDSPRRASSQSETSEEWKGYQATKMEADWQRESELKVKQHEWQGYALETLNEDELDSSTMMDGEFEKSRKARRQPVNQEHIYQSFRGNNRYV